MSKLNKKKVLKWMNNITTGILFTVLIGMLVVVVMSKASGGEPEIFGYQLKTVLSGSMEPGIKTGSIIAVKPGGDMTRFEKDDVITFMAEDEKLITHRIVEVVESGDNTLYRTKGDNNNAPDMDPVLSENVLAEYSGFTIPYVGYFVNFSQSKNGAFLLLIPGLILLCYSGFVIWRALSELDINNKKNKNSVKENAEVS
ncbi:signal peptidase I SipW [Virgibacillus oceani]|uniref:Signal peptidase I n=1 Tax=Virgibacillus oceani TaxID=1479511 RepID=A0A917LZN8_9BACI|nr:signal peptidase I [Virgibacillus oceani]GGG69515.1 S26 family signal peptidase [Virgibacillus oceani]